MKKNNIILIIIFLAVIVTPTVVMACTPGSELLVNEGRMSSVPQDVFSFESGINKAKAEVYVNDNIGFRDFAVTADMALKYQLFRYYSSYHIIQGKEGNDFYTPFNKGYSDQIQPFDLQTEEQYIAAKQNLVNVANWFEDGDIEFIFVTIPEKVGVYPELYPDTILVSPNDERLEKFSARLAEETDISILDISDTLRAAKEPDEWLFNVMEDPVHWNIHGAFIGYQAIMEKLKETEPSLVYLSENDIEMSKEIRPVKTADSLYTFPDRFETVYTYEIKNPQAILTETYYKSQVEDSFIPGSPMSQLIEDDFGDVMQYYKNPTKTGKLLLVGDSFIHQFLIPYFAESYGEIYFLTAIWDWKHVRKITELFEPDTVVYEISALNFREYQLSLAQLGGFFPE